MTVPSQSGTDSWTPALARRVDQVCTRFVAAGQSGARPRIEDYLGTAAGPERAAVLQELLALELEYRRRACEVPAAG